MKRYYTLILWLAFAIIPIQGPAIAGILEKVDAFRLPSNSMVVILQVTSPGTSRVDYRVAQTANGSSRTMVLNTKRKGQQYLKTSRGLWFYAPGTRRAIRVPPLQRLQGQTVLADIMQLKFGTDFSMKNSEKTTLKGRKTIKLVLNAKVKTSFKRIDLWVDAVSFFPIEAHYYLASGKVYRIAKYSKPTRMNIAGTGAAMVAKTVQFSNPRTPSKVTVLILKSMAIKSFPSHYFRVDALARRN